MTTVPQSPQLQVLGQKGPVMLANVSGANNPVAILDDSILDLLAVQCRKAKAEAMKNDGDANDGAVLELCATLAGILDLYAQILNKYYGAAGPESIYAGARHELETAIREMDKFSRPWK